MISISQLLLFSPCSRGDEAVLKRFFINEGDLSSLQNEHHVVDHQSFLKENQRLPSRELEIPAGE
jgi:hypothetical protein